MTWRLEIQQSLNSSMFFKPCRSRCLMRSHSCLSTSRSCSMLLLPYHDLSFPDFVLTYVGGILQSLTSFNKKHHISQLLFQILHFLKNRWLDNFLGSRNESPATNTHIKLISTPLTFSLSDTVFFNCASNSSTRECHCCWLSRKHSLICIAINTAYQTVNHKLVQT